MARTLSWSASSALFVLCCFLVANIANTIFASVLAPLPTARSAPPPALEPLAGRGWGERQHIVDRNLFNSASLSPAATREPELEELESTRLPLRLLGTAAASDPHFSWAAIEDLEKRDSQIVRVDDEVRPGARVARIEPRRVVLDENGSARELALDEEKDTEDHPRTSRRTPPRRTARRTPPRARPTASRVRRLDDSRLEVPGSELRAALRNPSSLLSQANIRLEIDEEAGEVRGLQINSPRPGSVFAEAGIQSGEVITAINGIPIDSAEGSQDLLDALADQSELTVEVEGASGRRTLTISSPEEE